MYGDYLAHYGVKGMKWGVRRYRNKDGSLTSAGRRRYSDLRKEYGRLEDQMTYGKNANTKKNAQISKRMAALEKEMKTQRERERTEAKTAKVKQKQYGRLEDAISYKKNPKEKDLLKTYGRLEDAKTYSKASDKKVEKYIDEALKELDSQLLKDGKKQRYDLNKVNDLINKAMMRLDDDLRK